MRGEDPGGYQLGSVGYADGVDTYDLANFVFDLRPNPYSGALTFDGSLALYDQVPGPGTPVDLDISMLSLGSGGTNSPSMFAAYRLNNFNPTDPNWPDGEFWAFASAPVPEPATLILLGSGLLGMAIKGRKRFRK